MRIWITRAAPEAEATAQRVRALGHEPVVASLLEVQAGGETPSLTGVGALAFTSRNGVRAFGALSAHRNLPIFTVGDATAEAARHAGFTEVVSASGDVEALAALIASPRGALNGEVLYLGPDEPAGDLVGALAAKGVAARSQVVYRTIPLALAEPPDAEVVLVHSAKAARRLAEDASVRAAAPMITALCISSAAARPLGGLGFREVLVAARPNEAAMLELLQGWAARQAPPRLFTPMFWIVIAFGLACIVAAILVARLGPQLFPARGDRPAAAHGSAASIPRKIGLKTSLPERAALAQPVERRIRNA